jgi:hypothetical protein
MTRRSVLLALVFALATMGASCKRQEDRCAYCGMKVKPDSSWRAIETGGKHAFDTPRCAFGAKLEGKEPIGALEMQDYYDRTMRPASELRFVAGSDVIGPMGPDLVPVKPDMVDKFVKDHGKTAVYRDSEVTRAVVDGLAK